MSVLGHNSYGKSDVRLTKVVRNGARHELYEFNASIQLEGDFQASYLEGDNRNVVATDSIKNYVYVCAKEHDFHAVEAFAVVLAEDIVRDYKQVSRATVELTQTAWQRINVGGKPHDHAFVDGGRHKRYVKAVEHRGNTGAVDLVGGVRDLLVIKTTASEWRDFHTDRYRTLKDTSDRIMATSIDADWVFRRQGDVDDWDDMDRHYNAITGAILETFATRHSLGVQQTIVHMGEAALAACRVIESISFALPNQHRIPFNLEPFGLTFDNDIFVATDEPYGLIKATIARDKS